MVGAFFKPGLRRTALTSGQFLSGTVSGTDHSAASSAGASSAGASSAGASSAGASSAGASSAGAAGAPPNTPDPTTGSSTGPSLEVASPPPQPTTREMQAISTSALRERTNDIGPSLSSISLINPAGETPRFDFGYTRLHYENRSGIQRVRQPKRLSFSFGCPPLAVTLRQSSGIRNILQIA